MPGEYLKRQASGTGVLSIGRNRMNTLCQTCLRNSLLLSGRSYRGFFLRRHSFDAALQRFHDVDYLAVLRRRRFGDHDFFTFALFIDHAEHADAVLVFVILRLELFRRKALDQTDAELSVR